MRVRKIKKFITLCSIALTGQANAESVIGEMYCIYTDYADVTLSQFHRERTAQSVGIVNSETTKATLELDGSIRAVNGRKWTFIKSFLGDDGWLVSDFGETLTLHSQDPIRHWKLNNERKVPAGVYKSTIVASSPEFSAYVRFGSCEVK